MFAPRFTTLGLGSRFEQPQGETTTYTMNEVPFTADSFNTAFVGELEEQDPEKVKFTRETKRNSFFDSSSSSVSISIEKKLLRLLLKENKEENFDQFKTHLLDYLNTCSLNFNEYASRADRINLSLINLYKTMLIYRPSRDIDVSLASDFDARYIALAYLQLFACLSCLLNQNEINMRKFMKTFQFTMNFNTGLRKLASTNDTSDEFTREKIEDLVYGIIRNAPKLQHDIEHFEFFKHEPALKALNSKILGYYVALANEYQAKLNINLEEVAKRHPAPVTQRCAIM